MDGREPSTRFNQIMYWIAWTVGLLGMGCAVLVFHSGALAMTAEANNLRRSFFLLQCLVFLEILSQCDTN